MIKHNTIGEGKLRGIFSAGGVAVLQGFEGIVFTFLGLYFVSSIFASPGFSVATLTVKEFFTFIILFFWARPKRVWTLFKRSLFNKDTRFFFIAGFLGTTLGNLFYLMAIQMGGSGYGVILTSLYPIFSLFLIRLVLKEKTNKKVLGGVFLAVTFSILFTLIPSLVAGVDFSPLKIVGIILGAVAALFWAIEGFLIHWGMKQKSNADLSDNDVVTIRCLGTSLMAIFFLLPLFTLINLASPSWQNPYLLIGKIFQNYQVVLILLLIALNLVVLRILHVYAISKVGAKLTAIIDSNNFLIPPLMSIFLSYANLTFLNGTEPLFEPIYWWAWLLIIPIILGVYIVLINQSNEKNAALEKGHDF